MDTNIEKLNSKLQDETQNIITIENLEEKLGTRKIDLSKKNSIFQALEIYFRMILKNPGVTLIRKNHTNILGHINAVSIEKGATLSWLSNSDEGKLAIRNNLGLSSTTDNSIIDMINNIINEPDSISQSEIVTKILEKLQGYSRDDVNAVLNGSINNPQYISLGKFQLLAPKFYVSCHSIFSKLAQIISDSYNVNVVFLMFRIASKDRSMNRLNPVILSNNMESSRQTLCININLHSLHPIQKRKEIELNKIIFEYIYELDYKNDNINRLLSTDITNNIIEQHSSELTRALVNKNVDIGNEISFEPFDKDLDLKVVEITIKGHKRSFLLGSTYNLYEDDDDKNNLVGKIKTWDTTTDFNAEIYWCNGYLEKLDN